jgi:AAA+ ATPase superfamily predicted ATPase
MKFYDRVSELTELERIRNLAYKSPARMTVLTGRRRIGKTLLILKSLENTPSAYLFTGRKNEALLCAEFALTINQALGVFIPVEIVSFRSLFQYLLELAIRQPFSLVIDEFQEFLNINPSIYHDMQNLWDQYRNRSKLNLILCGSVYSFMYRIFQDSNEPLFGRADNIIKLAPFDTKTLKEIMKDYRPKYTNDELLAFYAFTGGVPKYVEMLCDNTSLTIQSMIDFMARENSPVIDEGRNLLIGEFGKNYGMYFSILSAISGGINTQAAIEAVTGDKSAGGQLKRLIEDYGILVRRRPILAKEGTQAVRYEITDNFLQFWFNYFDRYRSLIEVQNFTALRALIKADYQTWSGKILERYFKQQFTESQKYRDIGSWWELKGNQNEIDIVALGLKKYEAVAVEVKRQKSKYKPSLLEAKVEYLIRKTLAGYKVEMRCLSLEDM